ncbi:MULTISPECIES: acyl-CoA thioesterase [Salinibaculum]|uniref:acyl-CoA thioesterase n=1 Tax=Salinibaculum TaxID=2732368 RepID=UPI0030CD60F0
MPYESTWTIYAGDTDYSGRIYTPVVIDYVIKTLGEFRGGVGFPNERFETGPVVPPARHIDIDYLGAIRVDDDLTIALTPTIGETSVTHAFTGTVDGDPVFEGELTVVYIDTETEAPVPVPEELVPELERIAGQ